MRTYKRMLFCVVALASASPDRVASGQTNTRADRTPLTFRDGGLYCNYGMWHGMKPETLDTTNMLPAHRAAGVDSPWSFYIMQYHAPQERRADFDGSTIQEMVNNGKKVVLRAGVGRGHMNPNVDEMEQRLVNMFEEVDPDLLYAITLDEEQIYWRGWGKALAELYHRCKRRWPDLPVYQWWSPNQIPNVRAQTGWVALPADGWIIDLYGVPRQQFEKKVLMCLETGKPLIHIAWASPDWPQYCGAESWIPSGRKIFDDQLDVCRSYNVPVAHFCTQKYVEKDGKRIRPILWGWHAVDPVVRAWYRELETLVMNLRTLSDDQIGFRTPDQRLFDWAHGSQSPVELTYALDDQGRKRFDWRSYGRNMPGDPGEHVLETPYDNPHVRVTLILDEAASRLDQGLGVRSIKGHANRVPLVFRIDPMQTVEAMNVTACVVAIKALGGSAHLAVSADGVNWSEPRHNDPSQKTSELTVASPLEDKDDAALWVRIMLEGTAGTPTGRAATLKWLEVSATFEPAL